MALMDDSGPKSLRDALDEPRNSLETLFLDPSFALVAIANGGISLGRIIQTWAPEGIPFGIVNATFHRDDIGLKPIPKNFQPTSLDFDIDGATILLIDDVFASGRTQLSPRTSTDTTPRCS